MNVVKFGESPVAENVTAELGDTSTTVTKYHVSDTVQVGVWECEVGLFTIDAHAVNEMCHILEGQGIVTHQDGTVCEFQAGDTLYIHKDTYMRWDVQKRVRKVYMVAP